MGVAMYRNRTRMCVSIFLLVMAAHPLLGQDNARIFDKLAGEWIGNGKLMGRTAGFTMTWERQEDFAILKFANGFVDSDRQVTSVLNSVAVYRTSVVHPEAVWLDSRNQRIEIQWEATDSTLVSHWTGATEAGRTTYRALSIDEIEVVDEVESGDSLRVFATALYNRLKPN